MERAAKNLQVIYKDQFYTKMIGEANEVTKKQIQIFKESGGKAEVLDRSLSNTIEYFVKQANDKNDEESKNLKRQLQLNEQVYFTCVIKGYAEAQMWADITKLVKMLKKCPVPFPTIIEICFKGGNMELVKECLLKGVIQNSERVELMIEF